MRPMSGSRYAMSSKPGAYAFSYGMRTISERLPTTSRIRSASAPMLMRRSPPR